MGEADDVHVETGEPALVGRTQAADDRDRIAEDRDALADERDASAAERQRTADDVEVALAPLAPRSAQAILDALAVNTKARAANDVGHRAQADRARAAAAPPGADWEPDKRDFVADDREHQADRRDVIADERERLADIREEMLRDLAAAVGLDAAGREGQALRLSNDGDRAERSRARTARDDAARARRLADEDLAIMRRSSLASELVAVAQALVHADTIDGALDEVVQAATRALGGCDDATFSMLAPGGEVVTPAAARQGGPGATFALAEYQAAEGPALDAIENQAVITTPDVTADARWPGLLARVADTPCRSVLSVPVVDEQHRVVLGALNCYSFTAEGFSDGDAECAVLLAAHLGAVMALALDAAAAGRRVVELGHAVQTRDVIGQAKGILMERQRLTADQAFDVLRRASQRLNRKLVDVANELAATGAITTEPE